MNSTHSSLLERLRRPTDEEAWDQFVRLYAPLLFHSAHEVGLQGPDAADLVQDVLVVLVRKLPDFQYDPRKSFRAWLRTVTLNKWRERLRRAPRPRRKAPTFSTTWPARTRWPSSRRRNIVANWSGRR